MNLLELLWIVLKSLVETILRWILPAKYKSVEGEVCLITGAGNGMGRLLAMEFAKRKAKLILWDMDQAGLEQTAKLVREIGGEVYAGVCDVSKIENIREAAVKSREAFGDITILVNNAGVVFAKDLLELTEWQIEQTFKVNVLAHFWMLREFLPSMLERNHGHVVTLASVVGLFSSPGMPDYCSSKHAAVGLHQALYYDLQKKKCDGIKTTMVCPYHVKTGMFKGVGLKSDVLTRSLSPGECVDAIMHAVLTNRPFVAVPRVMYISYNLSTWMPMKVLAAVYEYTGANDAISRFIPNRPYQTKLRE
uniref:Short-chain dehydrogenase/reductase 3 n=1 Tax=Phallusia mammillata TaxID=59560 RepID=A0A6F9DFI5_9ASCI|nr:estradiol 17-beta-dehydrogenase 11 [Phallusia mammillata]